MRWLFGVLLVLGLAMPAAAADFDLPPPSGNFAILRGPESVGPATFTRWSGFYFGGQFGLGDASANFSNATQSLAAFALRNTALEASAAPSQWPVLGTTNQSAANYGGFVGYNTQWQDLVVGMEANFNRAAFSLHAPTSPITRIVGDGLGNTYSLTMTGTGSLVTDEFATLRIRGGWVVGNFLPYAFVGFALGVANSSVTVAGAGTVYTSGSIAVCTASQPCYPISFSNSSSLNNAVLYGFTVGGGVDFAVTANIFLRAEFEWDQFNPPPGYLATVISGRVGGGLKF